MPENSGQSYTTFQSNYASRINVVYAGANDGFLHGFRTGFFDTNGQLDGTTPTSPYGATDNDGQEVLAFMPEYVANRINTGSAFQSVTGTFIQDPAQDYSSPLYAHKFSVDGTPGDGDLFYDGQWHSWLVGGLGAGGSAIYALDVTNPGIGTPADDHDARRHDGHHLHTNKRPQLGHRRMVELARLHDLGHGPLSPRRSAAPTRTSSVPTWAPAARAWARPTAPRRSAAFTTQRSTVAAPPPGARSSATVSAAITAMPAFSSCWPAPRACRPTFYYLSTGYGSRTGTPNGIEEVAPADLDGDHIIDYVYAGDILGNVWRFDLTSQNPSNWTVTKVGGVPTPVYSAPSGSPITTRVVVAAIASTPAPRILIEFGTGLQQQFTNGTPAAYSSTQQYLIGVWDWNMSAWNAISNIHYDALTTTTTPIAPTTGGVPAPINGTSAARAASDHWARTTRAERPAAPRAPPPGRLFQDRQHQLHRLGGFQCRLHRPPTNTAGICHSARVMPTRTIRTTSRRRRASLRHTSTSRSLFNPALSGGVLLVNTTIPPTTSINTCSSTPPGGWTMAIDPATGGGLPQSFFGINGQFTTINGQIVSGAALDGTGSLSTVLWTPPAGARRDLARDTDHAPWWQSPAGEPTGRLAG